MLPVKCWENGRPNSNSLIHYRFGFTTCPLWAKFSKELGNAIEWAGPLVLWHHVTL